MAARSALLALLAALVLILPGCGEDDIDRAREDVERRVDQARDDLREARDDVRAEVDRIRERLERVLARIGQVIPSADSTSPEVRGADGSPRTIDAFMTGVLRSVDRYWAETLRAAGQPEPSVSYDWIPPNRFAVSRCGALADENAAFYCPADDTIYIGQQFAADLYNGVLRGLPGEAEGGRAAGDFAVAYVIAHEYAHNVQQELGVYFGREGEQARPFELQADCLSGTWANSVFEQGLLQEGDIEEALSTALAIGDFEVGSVEHHGTPRERRDALQLGFRSGDPSVCSRFVPQV